MTKVRFLIGVFAALALHATASAQQQTILRNPTNTGPFGTTTSPIKVDPVAGGATSALQGVQATGAAYNPPTGGSGEIGYLSGLWAKANDTTPVLVQGGDAIDAAISYKPALIGCRASTASPTAVSADNDVQAARCDLNGNLVARAAPLTNAVSGVITSAITGTTSTSLIAAPGSGFRNYITHIACYNTDADTDTLVNVQDGSGGTTFYQVLALYRGGSSLPLTFPLRQPTANTALYIAPVTTGASITCSASGYKAE